jgi:D-arabinose 5-phosphate isomerase GutQ
VEAKAIGTTINPLSTLGKIIDVSIIIKSKSMYIRNIILFIFFRQLGWLIA